MVIPSFVKSVLSWLCPEKDFSRGLLIYFYSTEVQSLLSKKKDIQYRLSHSSSVEVWLGSDILFWESVGAKKDRLEKNELRRKWKLKIKLFYFLCLSPGGISFYCKRFFFTGTFLAFFSLKRPAWDLHKWLLENRIKLCNLKLLEWHLNVVNCLTQF